jgi:hypothetical protein
MMSLMQDWKSEFGVSPNDERFLSGIVLDSVMVG